MNSLKLDSVVARLYYNIHNTLFERPNTPNMHSCDLICVLYSLQKKKNITVIMLLKLI